MIKKTIEKHLKKGFLANGYLIEETTSEELYGILSPQGEVNLFKGKFGVDEARALKETSSKASEYGQRTFFILDASDMTREVPESILKTIEDAPPEKHFFIISSERRPLPETLRSRLVGISSGHKTGTASAEFKKFINGRQSLRRKMIAEIAKDEDGGKERFVSLLNNLEKHLMDEHKHELLPKIRLAKESALVFNAGRKMSLEYIASLL